MAGSEYEKSCIFPISGYTVKNNAVILLIFPLFMPPISRVWSNLGGGDPCGDFVRRLFIANTVGICESIPQKAILWIRVSANKRDPPRAAIS